MDNFRAFDEGADADFAGEEEPTMEAPPEIGVDERRMHVRAYNYWVSLLDGRAYPSIRDLEPQNIDDFGPHSVLLDFTGGSDNPGISFIGRALREECELTGDIRTIEDVPSRSLLSRLTDHYLQIIANCAPIGFEAEFVGRGGAATMYRGIQMPLSSDGDTIDFSDGVINWKEVADHDTAAGIAREAHRAAASSLAAEASPVWADGPTAEPLVGFADVAEQDGFDDDQHAFELPVDPAAGLAARLCVARETAEAVRTADVRSRAARRLGGLARGPQPIREARIGIDDEVEGVLVVVVDRRPVHVRPLVERLLPARERGSGRALGSLLDPRLPPPAPDHIVR